jgi:hypothetical protein
MKRGLHIVVSLLVVVLLIGPLDCFANAKLNQEAMDCCLKGQCAPTAKSDDCCRNSAPDGGQAVVSKAAPHSAPVVVAATLVFVGTPETATHVVSLNIRPRSRA